MKKLSKIRLALAAGVALLLMHSTLMAQSMWLELPGKNSFALEMSQAQFGGINAYGFNRNAWVFTPSLRMELLEGQFIKFELPIAYGSMNYASPTDPFDYSETALGNPYIGFEIRPKNSGFSFDLGARIPIAKDDKDFALSSGGHVALDRLWIFLPDLTLIDGLMNYKIQTKEGIILRFRFGPELAINSAGGGKTETELFLRYGAMLGYQNSTISILAGPSGTYFATAEDCDFSECLLEQFDVAFTLSVKRVRPGIHFKLPIDEEFAAKSVIGAHLAFALAE